jgi:hypothetical protein
MFALFSGFVVVQAIGYNVPLTVRLMTVPEAGEVKRMVGLLVTQLAVLPEAMHVCPEEHD